MLTQGPITEFIKGKKKSHVFYFHFCVGFIRYNKGIQHYNHITGSEVKKACAHVTYRHVLHSKDMYPYIEAV